MLLVLLALFVVAARQLPVLDRLADEVMTRLQAVRGFSGVERTWQGRSRRLELLMGIAVNNGILLVDFAKVARREGASPRQALLKAVELRTRPILMTAGASAVGMIPIALEWAVGIERLSPLAVVAIGGLIAGTFLTLLAVPVLYHMVESLRSRTAFAPATGARHRRGASRAVG